MHPHGMSVRLQQAEHSKTPVLPNPAHGKSRACWSGRLTACLEPLHSKRLADVACIPFAREAGTCPLAHTLTAPGERYGSHSKSMKHKAVRIKGRQAKFVQLQWCLCFLNGDCLHKPAGSVIADPMRPWTEQESMADKNILIHLVVDSPNGQCCRCKRIHL